MRFTALNSTFLYYVGWLEELWMNMSVWSGFYIDFDSAVYMRFFLCTQLIHTLVSPHEDATTFSCETKLRGVSNHAFYLVNVFYLFCISLIILCGSKIMESTKKLYKCKHLLRLPYCSHCTVYGSFFSPFAETCEIIKLNVISLKLVKEKFFT